MKKRIRIVALVMAVLLLVPVFSGCATKKKSNTT